MYINKMGKLELINLTYIKQYIYNGVIRDATDGSEYIFTTSLKKIESADCYMPNWIDIKKIASDGLIDAVDRKLREKLYRLIYTVIQVDINNMNNDTLKIQWIILLLSNNIELITELINIDSGIDWSTITVKEIVDKFNTK